jgi:hypothetical protein
LLLLLLHLLLTCRVASDTQQRRNLAWRVHERATLVRQLMAHGVGRWRQVRLGWQAGASAQRHSI